MDATKMIFSLFILLFFVADSGAAVTGNCISAPDVQDFVVSAKSGGIVWLGVGNVGVYEEFLARPNYELVKHMYAADILADPAGQRFVIFEGGDPHIYSFSDYKKIKKTSGKVIKDWSRLSWHWPESSDEIHFILSNKKDSLGIGHMNINTGAGGVIPIGSSKGYKSSAFDKKVSRAVIGFADGRIEVYSIEGVKVHAYQVHNSEVWAVAFHPTADLILSTGGDGRTVLYDLAKQQTLSIFAGSGKFLAFTANGTAFILGGWDSVGLYDLQGKPIQKAQITSTTNVESFFAVEPLHRVYAEDSESICWKQFDRWGEVLQGGTLPSAPQEPMYGGKPLSHYIQELHKDDVTARLMAMQAIEGMGPAAKSAMPDLLSLWDVKVEDKQGFYRGSLLDVFAALGPDATEAMLQIIQAMTDPNASVRQGAARTCAQMKAAAKEAVAPLIELTKDPVDQVREAAILALGEIGPDAKAAIPVLKQLTKEKNPTIKYRAEDAIKKIEGK